MAPPQVTWTSTANANGLVGFQLEWSSESTFGTKTTVRMPSSPKSALEYTLTAAEVARLKKLATAKGVASLYYRVRGSDAQKAFVTYSDPEVATVP